MDVFEVVSCAEHHILCKNGLLLHKRKLRCKIEKANEQNPYAVLIVKKTAGCTENQGSWPCTNWQHVVYFFSEVEYLMHNN